MKKKFLPLALLAVIAANAQQSDKAYALTDARKGGYNWNQIQQVDLKTGEIKGLTYDGSKAENIVNVKLSPSYPQGYAYNNGAAALAFDKKNNRLYFAPMFTPGAIRYINLGDKNPTAYQLSFDQKLNEADMEATNFTRMVIGSDGNGYAITNDANMFVKFGTGKKASVENLGGLVDDVTNGGISVHNRCSSWGGDMIADAYGDLYMITMRQNVFKVNPTNRIATYIGHIDGLPADFTCNGAAVNADGKVIVSGAAYTKGYFTVDMKTLKAEQLGDNTDVFNASDLATSNLYGQSEVDNSLNKMVTIEEREVGNDKISIYPNPVTDGRIIVSFDKMGSGNYTVELADQTAKAITRKQVTINSKGQTMVLNADRKLAKGMYFVRVIDANKKLVLGSRIVVQ
ncbi:MAG: T9SS type A sorting domain-containing protein [Bacteroidota bacterium]